MSIDNTEEKHESYGVVLFSRTSGSPGKLFGSHLPENHNFVKLTIKQATRVHRLSHETIYGKGVPLIEVWLSTAQFAELLTTMNIGEGVPCTIRSVKGEEMELPLLTLQTEAEKIAKGFEGDLEGLYTKFEKRTEACFDLLNKKHLGKKDKEDIKRYLNNFKRELTEDMPFILDSFQESVAKISQHAKAELDATLAHTAQKAGMEVLTSKRKSLLHVKGHEES